MTVQIINQDCSASCSQTLWNGRNVDPAVCGACKTGEGLIASGLKLSDAFKTCEDTLRQSPQTTQLLIQEGIINKDNAVSAVPSAEVGLVSVCTGAASKAYAENCVN